MAVLIKLLGFLICKIPYDCLDKACHLLACLFVLFPSSRRRVLFSNLRHAFPSWSKCHLQSVAITSVARMIEMGFFSLAYPSMSNHQKRHVLHMNRITENKLEELKVSEQPVLFLLPHVCLFETLAATPHFMPRSPKKNGAVYRPNRNPVLDQWIVKARTSNNICLFSRKSGLKNAMYFLREGNWLTVLFDQNGGEHGSRAMFLNRLTSVSTFPDLLSKTKQLRVFFALPRRVSFFKSKLELDELSWNQKNSLSQVAHSRLENLLTTCSNGMPEWLWAHGKWKIHYYPEVRFNIASKRSFLSNKSTRTGTKIFIRMPNWLGDVVMTLPILRALRQARPDMHFRILSKSCFVELLKSLDIGDSFSSVDIGSNFKLLHSLIILREEMPECHLLFTNSLRGDLESLVIGSPQRFGLEVGTVRRPILSHSYNVSRRVFETRHLTTTWGDMIKNFGFKERISFEKFILQESKTEDRDFEKIGIAIGSSNDPSKRWPSEYWVQMIVLIAHSYPQFKFFLYGTAGDVEISKYISDNCLDLRVQDMVGKTSVKSLALEFGSCLAVIGCDSGAVHLASAVGTPTLTIFGPTNSIVTAPCFDTPKIKHGEHARCSMLKSKPQEVFMSFRSLIKQSNIFFKNHE